MRSFLITILLFAIVTILNRNFIYAQYNDSGQKQGALGFYTPTPTKTPTPTFTLTPTPTNTLTPTPTYTPIPTSTPIPRSCGETCGALACQTGFTCITANDGNKYCAKANAATILNCSTNPSITTCCALPTSTPLPTATSTKTPTPSRLPTATPTNSPSPTPTHAINMNCDPNETELNPIYEYDGMIFGYGLRPDQPSWQWYYINYDADPDTILDEVQSIIDNQSTFLQSSDKKMEWDRDLKYFLRDLERYPGCPVRFTGSSPTLFLYGESGAQYSIHTGKITYADPPLHNNAWNVALNEHELEVNHMRRPYIYYEYEKLIFERPIKGWNINRDNINSFADKLSGLLKLNDPEKIRLIFELNHAASNIQEDNLFIGLINEKELDIKLPLISIPQPDQIARYHWYVGKAKGGVQAPDIVPLKRTTSLILELGAVGYGD